MPAEQDGPIELSASGYPVSVRVLNETEKVISASFRDFNDFPRDLANTLANIVHLSVLCVECHSDKDLTPCLLPYMKPMLKKLVVGSIGEAQRSRLELIFMAEVMELMVKGPHQLELLEQIMPRTRESFRQEPEHADMIYAALLDGLKYGIDRPSTKPIWKRAALRTIAKVREVPNLIDLLQKRTRFRHNFSHPTRQ